jgi:hypothetical protein
MKKLLVLGLVWMLALCAMRAAHAHDIDRSAPVSELSLSLSLTDGEDLRSNDTRGDDVCACCAVACCAAYVRDVPTVHVPELRADFQLAYLRGFRPQQPAPPLAPPRG